MLEGSVLITLINFTPNPELTVAIAMRQSRNLGSVKDLNLKEEDIIHLINLALQLGHYSVFEHISFTFAIEGISRSCSHQFVRHRFFSFTQQSQRYVKYENPVFIFPPSVKNNLEALEVFEKTLKTIEESYKKLLSLKIPEEDARFILPNATETKIVATANARELMHFFKLRLDPHAQWEIRKMAQEMFNLVSVVAPHIFNEENLKYFE
ncbi:FAD-dependent thymidylate synthase [Caldisericum exile]|uniref:Flavin-dependent thymidylate synthase n=1 Tax=Caldisericum exile (strain DSM 21853 / NBRC 104410 / AZM16c01) TaxID=511051 RepID=A0A7U6GDC0_CALEA|nr:FAD-dependent thymidylate synthase [Caldisericum exile]BAL80327.1 thymidylate synthase ThyX [Caldisericum exile AZM16c01]